MPALKTSGSFQRYFLDGEALSPQDPQFLERLHEHRFKTIEDSAEESESVGWVTSSHPFDTEFTLEKIFVDPYVSLVLRRDVKRVPRTLVKAYVEQEAAAMALAEGQEKISRNQKREIQSRIEADLTKRALPSLSTTVLLWNTERQILFFYATSQGANDALNRQFRLTFDCGLIPAMPILLAERLQMDNALRSRLSHIDSCRLAGSRAPADHGEPELEATAEGEAG
ncbi:MAG: recombination-associated protein RdgC [Planctomycetota bacterium]